MAKKKPPWMTDGCTQEEIENQRKQRKHAIEAFDLQAEYITQAVGSEQWTFCEWYDSQGRLWFRELTSMTVHLPRLLKNGGAHEATSHH